MFHKIYQFQIISPTKTQTFYSDYSAIDLETPNAIGNIPPTIDEE